MRAYSREEADALMIQLAGYDVQVKTNEEKWEVARAMYPVMKAVGGSLFNSKDAESYIGKFRESGNAKSHPYMVITSKRMGHSSSNYGKSTFSVEQFMQIVSPTPLRGLYE